MSPKAHTSPASIPSSAHQPASAAALVTPFAETSASPPAPLKATTARSPTISVTAVMNSSSVRCGLRASSLPTSASSSRSMAGVVTRFSGWSWIAANMLSAASPVCRSAAKPVPGSWSRRSSTISVTTSRGMERTPKTRRSATS